ncbi:cell wall elongation regulator TseB-like domain-containing protein [Streptococcus phocae subsp. salmonis]
MSKGKPLNKRERFKSILYVCAGLINLICIGVLFLFYVPIYERIQEKSDLVLLAQAQTPLKKVSHIEFYDGQKAYASVFGKDSSGHNLIVSIEEGTQHVILSDPKEGISKDAARAVARKNGAKDIQKVVFGIDRRNKVWEVCSQQGNYMIDFKTGKLLRKERL